MAVFSHYGTTRSSNFLVISTFIHLMIIDDDNDFEEISDWTVPSGEKNYAIFSTVLVFKFCILIICKMVIQV